jgi:Fe-S cluster assembly protein SufD
MQTRQQLILKNQEIQKKLKEKLEIPENLFLELFIIVDEAISLNQKLLCNLQKNSHIKFVLILKKPLKINFEIKIVQNQLNSESQFFCLLLADENTSINLDICNIHQKSQTNSVQKIKSLCDKNGKIEILSTVEIKENIAKVETNQELKNLFLSQNSSILARPELKIESQDVSARHGFASSKINPADYFYLKTRGIREKDAKKILIDSFTFEILEKLDPICLIF